MDLADQALVIAAELGFIVGYIVAMTLTFLSFRSFTRKFANDILDAFKSEIEWEAAESPAAGFQPRVEVVEAR